MEFSQRLIAARKARGLSQEVLAEKLGVSRQAVSKWETGESKPDVGNLIALCGALELDIAYLCLGTEQAPEQPAPKKGLPRWAKRLLSAVCALALLAGGVGIGAAWAYRENISSGTEVVSDVDITAVRVIAADASYNAEKDCYEITVTPSVVYDGMELLIRASPNTGGSDRSFLCTLERGTYTGYFRNADPDVEYTFTAVFSCGGAQKQVALMKFRANASGDCGFQQLWDT